jgi:hypothetical protein
MEVMEKHKIHPKEKAPMNILFYRNISMPIIHLMLKIDVMMLKMEHAMSLKFLQPPLKGDIRWLVVTTITLLAIV